MIEEELNRSLIIEEIKRERNNLLDLLERAHKQLTNKRIEKHKMLQLFSLTEGIINELYLIKEQNIGNKRFQPRQLSAPK